MGLIEKTWREVYRSDRCDNPFALYVQVHRTGDLATKVLIRIEPLEVPLRFSPQTPLSLTPCPSLAVYKAQKSSETTEGKSRVLEREGWGTPTALVALYNDCTPGETPAVERLSPGRLEKARKALRDQPAEDFWRGVFAEFHRSQWLRGLESRMDYPKIARDFDWLLQRGKDGVENYVKVSEGKYRDGQ